MLKRTLLPLFLGCALLLGAVVLPQDGAAFAQAQADSAAVVHADPSSQQIYAVARAGNLSEAQAMIEKVLRDYPANAKAHWVAAEVFARSGQFPRARQELRTAQSLSPGLPFVRATSVTALQRQLASGRATGAPAHHISWGGVVLVIGLGALIYALLRRRTAAVSPYGTPYGASYGQPGAYPGANPYGPYPNVAPYGPGGMPMGRGSGLMGNLATGLAVGAGVAAGEELVQHALGGGMGGSVLPGAGGPLADDAAAAANPDMGGSDFGIANDNGSWDAGGGDLGGNDFGGDMGGGDMGGGDLGGGGDWT
jgi:uncharacterized protein